MKYELVKSSKKDIDRLIEYKKRIIYEYAKDLSIEEVNKIDEYVTSEVSRLMDDYYNIVVNNKIIGSLLLTEKDDGKLLDEIYLEEEYRNNGIGTDIINNIISNNDIIYLWVYKDNEKAISLYKRLNFNIVKETESRYYMKHNN